MILFKNYFILGSFAILFLAGCGAVFVNKGSKDEPLTDGLRNPADMVAKVIVPANQKIVGDFEDGSTNLSSKLYGGNGGTWNAFASGGNTLNSPYIVSGGANGTKMAAHLFGTLVNKGDAQYPAFTLQAMLKKGGAFDASMFQGIRFYYKSSASDKALTRRFSIPIGATLPSSNGGTCSDGCYNHFGADLSVTGDWAQKTYAFSDLKRGSGWGSPVTPPDFTDHLKELITIEWNHNAQNTAGSYDIDYWVDEIEFF